MKALPTPFLPLDASTTHHSDSLLDPSWILQVDILFIFDHLCCIHLYERVCTYVQTQR